LEFKSKFLSGKKEGGIFPDKILKMGSWSKYPKWIETKHNSLQPYNLDTLSSVQLKMVSSELI
jgi:hypothetical protein